MLPDYADIHEAAGFAIPDWYDQNGVPRYAPFTPDMLGVYDCFALLVTIACQSCADRFLVGCGWPRSGTQLNPETRTFEVANYSLDELARGFAFGDPPFHGTVAASMCGGTSMSSVAVRISEAWERRGVQPWERRADLEAVGVLPRWVREDGDEARFCW